MKKWIQELFGISKLREQQEVTNILLKQLLQELQRNSALVEAYNKAYGVRG